MNIYKYRNNLRSRKILKSETKFYTNPKSPPSNKIIFTIVFLFEFSGVSIFCEFIFYYLLIVIVVIIINLQFLIKNTNFINVFNAD